MARRVRVVAHTHWDREWYVSFEVYRSRLVPILDSVIDLLETDRRFAHFHLDGQIAVVDDYLEARPAARERLASLVAAGRLAVGPWYVLMDEFCVSAETIVRNLQLGLSAARDLGSGVSVGYLPDMFGHIAQMPQILSQAGIEHAVVWRGVPSAVDRAAFRWEAPDGSACRAEYLPVGYASGAFLPRSGADLLRRVEAHDTEVAGFLGEDWPLLLMNGGDHQGPQIRLPDLLEEANAMASGYSFEQTSLLDHLCRAPASDLPTWRGELRSGARAPLLAGVLSNRVDIKQAAASAEGALERTAEPLATLWLPAEHHPLESLDRAWRYMVLNSAHDSVCACSADEVGRAVLVRYEAARSIADEVTGQAEGIAAVALADRGWVALNPLPQERGGIVEAVIPGTDAPEGTQQVWAVPAGTEQRSGLGRDLALLLAGLAADGWLGASARVTSAAVRAEAGGLYLYLRYDPSEPPEPESAPVMAEAWARAGAGRDQALTVVVERSAAQSVLVPAVVPGWGWALVRPGDTAPAGAVTVHTGPGGAVRLENGLVTVEIDGGDGTFSVGGQGGMNVIEEQADVGDTYNFQADGEATVDPVAVSVELIESGPVRGVVRVRRLYRWGDGAAAPGDGRASDHEVVSDVELRHGESAVRVTTTLDHRGSGRRLRVLFPLGPPVRTTTAECVFGVVERGEAEGGPQEPARATWPSRRFVSAGPVTVVHEGLLEHELTDSGRTLAVALLRAVGTLALPSLAARPAIAGPPVAVPDAQMPGRRTFRYAVAVGAADPWTLADEMWTPLEVTRSAGIGNLAPTGRRLAVAGVKVSALRRQADGRIELRVFNPAPTPATASVPGRSGTLVDLTGKELGTWAGSFEVGPWRFATTVLDSRSLD